MDFSAIEVYEKSHLHFKVILMSIVLARCPLCSKTRHLMTTIFSQVSLLKIHMVNFIDQSDIK